MALIWGLPSNQIRAISARVSPQDGQRGKASGRPNRRGGTPKSCRVSDSGSKKRGYTYFGPFLAILWDFLRKRCAILPSQGIQASRENHLRGRVDLGYRHAGWAKLTLGRTSEMTPDGWYYTGFAVGARKSYVETPPGGTSAPLLRGLTRKPPWGAPKGRPKKG